MPGSREFNGLPDFILGMGEDGAFWGGEFLIADFTVAKKLAGFRLIPMSDGTMAMREPCRNTLGGVVR